jgi:hypothetical protein
MSRIFLACVFVVSLSSLVGCGASSKASRTTSVLPTTSAVAQSRTLSLPPEELELSFDDAPSRPHVEANQAAISCRPNESEKPTSGAVHAAY